jgi:hypothetical protein
VHNRTPACSECYTLRKAKMISVQDGVIALYFLHSSLCIQFDKNVTMYGKFIS